MHGTIARHRSERSIDDAWYTTLFLRTRDFTSEATAYVAFDVEER